MGSVGGSGRDGEGVREMPFFALRLRALEVDRDYALNAGDEQRAIDLSRQMQEINCLLDWLGIPLNQRLMGRAISV